MEEGLEPHEVWVGVLEPGRPLDLALTEQTSMPSTEASAFLASSDLQPCTGTRCCSHVNGSESGQPEAKGGQGA